MPEPVQTCEQKSIMKKLLLICAIASAIFVLGYSSYLGLEAIIGEFNNVERKTVEAVTLAQQVQVENAHIQQTLFNLQRSLQQTVATKTPYWRLLVIEHLVQLADLTLNTAGDVKLALAFLAAAKQYATDPDLVSIAQSLDKDNLRLQTVPLVDTVKLVSQLEDLSYKINALPVIGQRNKAVAASVSPQSADVATHKKNSLWQRFVHSTVSALKEIIIVRHHSLSVLPAPEQEIALLFEIKIKLLQAQLAVMHHQNQSYQASLSRAKDLLKKCFSFNQEETDDILSTIQKLQEIDLRVKPTLAIESVATIRSFIASHNMTAVNMQPPAEEKKKS